MDKKYAIIVNGERVEVTKEVYQGYYQEKERERYLKNQSNIFELSLDKFSENGDFIEHHPINNIASVEDKLVKKELLQTLNNSLKRLEKEELELIIELFFNDKSERKLSIETGIPRMTICSRKNKIIAKLRRFLKDYK